MHISPTFHRFREYAAGARVVPVWREFLFDVDTAVTAYAKLARPPFGFLLESVVGGEQWARYSFLGTRPAGAWRLQDGQVSWWTPDQGWSAVETDDPLADLDARLRARTPASVPGLPRFWGGAVGYFGYDVVRRIERLPDGPPDDLGIPDGLFVFTDLVLAIDNLKGRAMAIAAVSVDVGQSDEELRRRYDDASARIDDLIGCLADAPPPPSLTLAAEPDADPAFTSSTRREDFEAGVERIREYIRAGDAFQVVLSQRLGVQLDATPFQLYRALRTLNPSPYLYFLELDGVALVGSSPEVLVRVEDGTVTVRPIAGTRPRGQSPEEDALQSLELLVSEKERAEHIMLVDLARNDLGRICTMGSVNVDELMALEEYSHVIHIVSNVSGLLRRACDPVEIIRAVFPGGTITGCPKVRCMEILRELEPVPRELYTGSVGYLAFDGTMDLNIAIRTMTLRGTQLAFHVGAGIVADSQPAREFDETLSKAQALVAAVGQVHQATETWHAPIR